MRLVALTFLRASRGGGGGTPAPDLSRRSPILGPWRSARTAVVGATQNVRLRILGWADSSSPDSESVLGSSTMRARRLDLPSRVEHAQESASVERETPCE